MYKRFKKLAGAVALIAFCATSLAGPVVIDGTDANDHGSVSGGANQSGWRYMQLTLQSLAPAVGNGNMIVVDLGTTGGQARAAINSAFGLSTLGAAGWTLVNISGSANIASYLAGNTVNGVSLATTGIMAMASFNNSSGDLDAASMAAINAGAAAIANFVGGAGNPLAGGGLFSMAQSGTGAYGWLTTLISGIVPVDVGTGGISDPINLTAAGMAAFPGLTNADLSSGPWHGHFQGNLGGLSVLGQSQGRAVIIGGGAGTIIGPTVPENGASIGMLALALAAVAGLRRKFGV